MSGADLGAHAASLWMLLVYGDERGYGGNVGYDDDPEHTYHYDNFVPNYTQIQEGDLAVLVGPSRVLGMARIARIEEEAGTKQRRRCPVCRTGTVNERTTLTPRWRCQNGHEFDEPLMESVECTNFTAHYDGSFLAAESGLDRSSLPEAALNYNGQLAMQRLDPAQALALLEDVIPGSRELASGIVLAEPARYWKIAPGEQAREWSTCRDAGFISLGWEELGDLTGADRAEYERRRDEVAPKYEYGPGVEQVWTYLGLRPGDEVIANNGLSKIVGIGTVTGPYYFAAGQYHAHRFPIHWHDVQQRQVEELGWRRTLISLEPEHFERLVVSPLDASASSPAPSTPDDVATYLRELLPDAELRHALLMALADGIEMAAATAPESWGVTIQDDRVRLHLGWSVPQEIHDGTLRVSLARDTLHAVDAHRLDTAGDWTWSVRDTLAFDHVPISNGRWLPTDPESLTWSIVHRGLSAYMHEADLASPGPDRTLLRRHSPAFLAQLRAETGRLIPEPMLPMPAEPDGKTEPS